MCVYVCVREREKREREGGKVGKREGGKEGGREGERERECLSHRKIRNLALFWCISGGNNI